MQIFTSYFGNMKQLEKADIVPIGIAIKPPRFFKGVSLKNLAPRYEMIHWPEDRYTPEFKKILKYQDAKLVYNQLESSAGGKNIALLCYEKPGEFCHRRLVAEWIEKELNIKVDEFVKKDERVREQSLF